MNLISTGRTLVYKHEDNTVYLEDCKRIQAILKTIDVDASIYECNDLWASYSGEASAQWLSLPNEDETLVNILKWELKTNYDNYN